jgi:hypothetical protein
MNLRLRRFYRFIMVSVAVLLAITVVGAQEFITLANDKGTQKTIFARGEGIQIVLTLPYNANVQVLLHNPPGTAGPSPTLFIPATPVPANIQTVIGPKWLDERAPCGKYRLEIVILNPPPPLQPKTEYRYFDYAMNEPQCSPPTPPPPPPPDMWWLFALGASAVAIVAIAAVLMLTRWRVPPPKERAIIPPPVTTTPSPPTAPSAPPKPQHRRTPVVRGTEREEERL